MREQISFQPPKTPKNAYYIQKLQLKDFRNYPSLSLECAPTSIVIIGDNGAGKTNILEALSLIGPGRGGLRNAALPSMVRQQKEEDSLLSSEPQPTSWSISAWVQSPYELMEITSWFAIESQDSGQIHTGKRHIKINGQMIKSHTELSSYVSVIWVTPQMDPLFLAASSERRKFLDRLVYQFDPDHARRVLRYEHAMRERAKLLKQGSYNDPWITILERQMVEYGVAIAVARRETLSYLQQTIDQMHTPFPQPLLKIKGEIEEWLEHEPALAVEGRYIDMLKTTRALDQKTARTNTGIHRADLLVFHKSKNIPASQCSTGEQKALLLSIILSEAKARRQWRNITPLLLLDEVVAHLDKRARGALFELIDEIEAQAWLTGTDPSLFEGLQHKAQFFTARNNHIFC